MLGQDVHVRSIQFPNSPDGFTCAVELDGGGHIPNVTYELIKACATGMVMEDPGTKVATANELFAQLKEKGMYI